MATAVVASVVTYDDSWTFLQKGGLVKSPAPGSWTTRAAQNEISPEVTAAKSMEEGAR